MIIPDIKNGFITNGVDNPNSWQTFIESCLIKSTNGSDQRAFLATSCRAEYVSRDSIFVPQGYEFSVAHTWNGPIAIRSGTAIYVPFFKKASEARHYGQYPIKSEIHAPNASATEIKFGDLLALLQSQAGRNNFIYMEVEWAVNNSTYKLLCPCRYINFPAPEQNDERYLQPISGNVLVEIDGKFHLAYVSVHVTEHGAEKTELMIKDTVSLFNLKYYPLRRNRSKSFIRCIPSIVKSVPLFMMHSYLRIVAAPFSYFFKTDEFYKVISLNAKCRFFIYDDT